MKQLLLVISLLFAMGGGLPQEHIHDAACGYDPVTGSGCMYDAIPLIGGRYGD